uniref:Uncharacterized protein n=1 Tax=Rhizophora mucronata TaxID=61149 RepID=A0A2P2LJV7_RHIMU
MLITVIDRVHIPLFIRCRLNDLCFSSRSLSSFTILSNLGHLKFLVPAGFEQKYIAVGSPAFIDLTGSNIFTKAVPSPTEGLSQHDRTLDQLLSFSCTLPSQLQCSSSAFYMHCTKSSD